MTAPRQYDDLSIGVQPNDLESAYTEIAGTDPKTIGGLIGQAVDSLNRIQTTLFGDSHGKGGLAIGWAGKTADEAKEFFTDWSNSMTQLLGDPKVTDSGFLPRMTMSLGAAAGNYSAAEDGIAAMLQQMTTQFGAMVPSNTSDPAPKPMNGPASIVNLTEIHGGPAPIWSYLPPPDVWTDNWYQGAVAENF